MPHKKGEIMNKVYFDKIKSFYKKNKILAIGLIVLIGLGIAWGRSKVVTMFSEGNVPFFGQKKAQVEELEPIIPVNVMAIKPMDFKDMLSAIGTIKGAIEIDLKFQENGYIDSFKFKEGELVKKGDALAALNPKEKEIKLNYAKIEFDKNQKLYELGGIAKPKFEQSELELDSAENEFNKTLIFAPSDGFMGTTAFDKGAFVTSNDKVGTFVDTSFLKCEVGVIEKDADKVKVDQKALITVDTFPDKTFDAVVDSVSPMLEGRSKTQTVKMKLANQDNAIKPGMFARANIIIFEKPNAVVIPTSALKKTDEGFSVFTIERTNLEEEKAAKEKSDLEKSKKSIFEKLNIFKKSAASKAKPTPAPASTDSSEVKPDLPVAAEENALVVSASEEKSPFGVAKEQKVTVGRISQDLALIDEGLKEGDEIIVETPESKEKLKEGTKVEVLQAAE